MKTKKSAPKINAPTVLKGSIEFNDIELNLKRPSFSAGPQPKDRNHEVNFKIKKVRIEMESTDEVSLEAIKVLFKMFAEQHGITGLDII
jgi:hypothetical protein